MLFDNFVKVLTYIKKGASLIKKKDFKIIAKFRHNFQCLLYFCHSRGCHKGTSCF